MKNEIEEQICLNINTKFKTEKIAITYCICYFFLI